MNKEIDAAIGYLKDITGNPNKRKIVKYIEQLEKENQELKQQKGLNGINEEIISGLESGIQKYLPCYEAMKILQDTPCLVHCLIERDEEETEIIKKALRSVKE